MLVLARRPGESITIGDDIKVTVLSASNRQVRIGISAPRHIPVLREEIYRAIQEENQAAAHSATQRRQLDGAAGKLRELIPRTLAGEEQ